jgi:phage terminase Nu1 subunit (DNA packaging protein)
MLVVPSRVRQRLGHLTVADVEVIDREVRDALTEAAGDEVVEASAGCLA